MNVLHTPEDRFRHLSEFPYPPHYTDVGGLRMAHVEDGPPDADPVLLLHGEPSWGYLYRRMIPVFAAAGHRVLAPDLVGFGRSDKPASPSDYSYQRLVDWTWSWVESRGLDRITLVCQDWGSLIGLRLVGEHPERFARVAVANGFLPTGDREPPLAFKLWRAFARWSPFLPVGAIVQFGTATTLPRGVLDAYRAPFPGRAYKAGARALPGLVPTTPADPAAPANRAAWAALGRFEKPFLTAFASGDPITRGADRALQRHVPGAAGQPHTIVRGAGHFIQEDRGEELARVVVDWMGDG